VGFREKKGFIGVAVWARTGSAGKTAWRAARGCGKGEGFSGNSKKNFEKGTAPKGGKGKRGWKQLKKKTERTKGASVRRIIYWGGEESEAGSKNLLMMRGIASHLR